MKHLLFTLLIFGCTTGAYCQMKITGKVTAGNGKAVPFANVLLLNLKDSSLIKGGIANEAGEFEVDRVKGGQYFLRYCAIGYRTLNSAAVELTGSPQNKDVGAVVMDLDFKDLKDITIQAGKPLYYQETDRMVVNLQSTILSKGHSGYEILEMSPGVYIDRQTGVITLKGKSGVTIMVNGRRIFLQQEQASAFLNSMNADNIERIELIPTPSPKYDAEGSAGIINFILKKNVELGTKGSFSLTGKYGYGEKGNANVELAHNTEKTGIYGSYSFSHDRSHGDWFATGSQVAPLLGGAMNFDFWNNQEDVNNSHQGVIGMDTRLKKTTIGGVIVFNSSNTNASLFNHAQYTIYPDSILIMHSGIERTNRWRNTMASFYAERQIREGEKINIDISYLYYMNNNPTDVRNSFIDRKGSPVKSNDTVLSSRHDQLMRERIKTGVAKVDYVKQLHKNMRLEAGIKETYSKSSSVSSIATLVDNGWLTGPKTNNDLLMKEDIGAAYANIDFKLTPTANLAIGGRYEYSHTVVTDQYSGKNLVDRRLGVFMPNIVFSKAINDRSSWQLSYTKRLTRPSYTDLLSFISYNDPVSVGIGNPLLKPTITHNLKAAYSYKGYSFSVLASRDDHPIASFQVVTNSSGDLLYISSQNLRYQNSLLLQADAPLKVTDWWSMNQGFFGGWRQYKVSFTKDGFEKTYFGYSVYSRQAFKLPGAITLELSGRYNAAFYNGTVKIDANKSVNAAISKQLKNNKGSLLFSVDDVFRSLKYTSYYGTLTQEAYSLKSYLSYNPESRKYTIFRLSYFRSFGNDKLKSHKKDTGIQDEWERIRR
jgi:iron complex outermembrane recepter protein